MKLWAISDVHVGHADNRALIEALPSHPDDWLIVGGDVGETIGQMELTFDAVVPRYAKVIWVPGNHELWTVRSDPDQLRGVAKYDELVALCRSRGVLTPEDGWPRWPGEGPPTIIAPMFLLYDYSYRPSAVVRADVVTWAKEENSMCVDEELLHPDPFPTRDAWCRARVDATRARLEALPAEVGTILVNHFPLRQRHAILPLVPRFSPWCGTTLTDDWHLRYRARAVVYGHLHIPRTHVDDGVPFEEVSLGYPTQRLGRARPPLRQIWPRPL